MLWLMPPKAQEESRALSFVARSSAPPPDEQPRANVGIPSGERPAEASLRREDEAWSLLAQVLLISNEFLFVD